VVLGDVSDLDQECRLLLVFVVKEGQMSSNLIHMRRKVGEQGGKVEYHVVELRSKTRGGVNLEPHSTYGMSFVFIFVIFPKQRKQRKSHSGRYQSERTNIHF
jgi:hypothetical protein